MRGVRQLCTRRSSSSAIVVAWDASPQSAPALDLAIGYARARDADLVIDHGRAHAIEPDADAELGPA